MHGDLQPVALGLHVRIGHRPGHGVPGLEPGPARARPCDPRARPGAASSTSLPRSSPTAAPITNTSRSPNAATMTSAPGSTTTRRGSCSPSRPTSRRPAICAILDEPVPWDNAEGSETPLRDHLRRCIDFTLDRLGPHGLPLIGRADWNDCLNLNVFSDQPGESFQTAPNLPGGVAESVFIAGLFVLVAREAAALAALCGDEAEACRCREAAATMTAAIEAHALGRGVVPAGVRPRRATRRVRRERRRPDLHRTPGDDGDGGRRARGRAHPDRDRLRPGAAGDAARDPAPAAGLHELSPRARRDLLVPAGLQGERRGLLPHEPVADDRRGDHRQRRRRARLLPADQPLGP